MSRHRPSSVGARIKAVDSDSLLRARSNVQEAERLRLAGKLDRAESICSGLLREFPDYVAALQTMGLVLADRSQDDRALTFLQRAFMLNPDEPNILTALSGVCLNLGAHRMAAKVLDQARQLAPDDANILAMLGEIYRADKEYELSKKAYEAALRIDPAFVAAETGLATSLMHIGQLSEATAILERLVRQGSRSIPLVYMLSEMPSSVTHLGLLALLDEIRVTAAQYDPKLNAQLAFTRAHIYDRAGRYEEAWAHLKEGRRYNYSENRRQYQTIRQFHARLLELARRSGGTPDADDRLSDLPISLFIVGPSRSGKTSLERLVGTLPDVARGYENPIVENAVRRTFQTAGFPTSSLLVELPPPLSPLFKKFYCEELRQRAGSAKILTNTLPERNEDAFRIASEIPNARFVFIKRDIDDVCLRIFMRLYRTGNPHSSELRDTRDHVTFCHDMIDVMAEKLPRVSRVVNYEDMVADPAATLTKIAELCRVETIGGDLPAIGDDRGCAAPYRERMKAALQGAS